MCRNIYKTRTYNRQLRVHWLLRSNGEVVWEEIKKYIFDNFFHDDMNIPNKLLNQRRLYRAVYFLGFL